MKLNHLFILVLATAFISSSADAKKRRKRKRHTKSSRVKTAARNPFKDKNVNDLLVQAREMYKQLEYDQVIPLTKEIVGRSNASMEQKLDAFLLQASCLAIVGDPIDAETPFRLLLEYRPEYDMPSDTPPKILAVFRKVKVEVDEFRFAKERMLRKRIIAEMEIKGNNIKEQEGGLPIVYSYQVKDPKGIVSTVVVHYRKKGDSNYSVLALKRTDLGDWKGAISGDWTANEEGFILEYFVETRDDKGALKQRATAKEPLNMKILPGSADRAGPPPLPIWSFGIGATTATAATLIWAGLGATTAALQLSFWEYQKQDTIDGAELNSKSDTLQTMAIITNVAIGATVLAWSTVSGMAFFTNWDNEQEPEYH